MTECSAVGSALRSGRRGRAFESPHSDKRRQMTKIICRFLFFFFFVIVLKISSLHDVVVFVIVAIIASVGWFLF